VLIRSRSRPCNLVSTWRIPPKVFLDDGDGPEGYPRQRSAGFVYQGAASGWECGRPHGGYVGTTVAAFAATRRKVERLRRRSLGHSPPSQLQRFLCGGGRVSESGTCAAQSFFMTSVNTNLTDTCQSKLGGSRRSICPVQVPNMRRAIRHHGSFARTCACARFAIAI
jgi:hypothetical protein